MKSLLFLLPTNMRMESFFSENVPSELISPLQNHYHNIVWNFDRNPTDFAYDEVICNGTNAAITAMNYLISLGHKKSPT